MPYVPVPKDLTKIKTKVAFNLTKRQLIFFSLAGLAGLPTYFLTRTAIGNSAAVLLMIGLMMPFFFVAMYEKDGLPAEKILKNMLRHRKWPQQRPCKTENFYKTLSQKEGSHIGKDQAARGAGKAPAARYQANSKEPGGGKKGR